MKFKLKDPGSAITHGIAFLLAAAGAAPLLIRAAGCTDHLHLAALSIFILTMMLLYAASTIYHSVDSTEKVNRRLRKMDHMMIFVMIAGSYTPVCLIVLHNHIGYILCAMVWTVAILGILFKGFWVTCPKWLSSLLYIGMGWLWLLSVWVVASLFKLKIKQLQFLFSGQLLDCIFSLHCFLFRLIPLVIN